MRALVLAAVALVACAKDEEAPRKPPMPAVELDRGIALCEAYVARLCACAAKDASLQGQCDLSRGQPEALKLHINLLRGQKGPLNEIERRMTEASTREIIAACVSADGQLDPVTCPRAR